MGKQTANLQQLEERSTVYSERTEIVILPEMFSTGLVWKPELLAETMEGDTVAWMKRVAASRRIILTGSNIIEESGEYYNRLIWMLPNGRLVITTNAIWFAYADEHEHYASGQTTDRICKRLKINPLICHDLCFHGAGNRLPPPHLVTWPGPLPEMVTQNMICWFM